MAVGDRFVAVAVAFFVCLAFVQLITYVYLESLPTGPEISRYDVTTHRRANAVILVLCRSSDLEEVINTLKQLEQTFNSRFNYPYVFLNEQPFSEQFKQQITRFLKGGHLFSGNREITLQFGLVPKEHWSYPEWIDQEKAAKARLEMKINKVVHGELESYHHMCRYFSGFFYRHPLLLEYDYYWRVEPGAEFYCPIFEDPFLFMENHNIEYGFSAILPEFENTVPTLWNTTRDFLKMAGNNFLSGSKKLQIMKLLFNAHEDEDLFTDDDFKAGLDNLPENVFWNGCHFWSNFEIGHFAFFRSEFYQSYFDYLDRAGGFYYERWGDAPVHSLAVAMFLEPSQIHHFADIGYRHGHGTWCPLKEGPFASKCNCKYDWLLNMAKTGIGCFTKFMKDYRKLYSEI